jgi:quaternary ammonium compound-resistance protein SugE
MAWGILFVAGLFEACWAIGLKYTDGFSRPLPTALTLIAVVISMWLLAVAARDLPIGTAYAVWTAIGVFGTTIAGVALFGEPVTPARMGFLALLLISIAGLKLTAPLPTEPSDATSP